MNHCFERAIKGDPTAVETVVEALRPRITKMAAYYAHRTGEEVDDLLQEAFVGLLEALPNLDLNIGSPDQYLVQHARWRLLDTIKRARVRRCAPLDDACVDHHTCSPMEAAVSAACAKEFADKLKALQRAILDCLLVGYTWREAGAALGCTSANIAYHMRQIKRQYEEWSAEQA
jgi:RNA polymerase sigma factor (sigma-70 family)